MLTATLPRIISVEGDIITIDFDAMENMTPEQRLQCMIAAGNYENRDAITADKFPVEGTGKKNFRNKPFYFRCNILSEDAETAIKKEKFTPATHVHGLAFGKAFPDEQRKHPIACLGSSAQVDGDRRVVCLGGGGVGRRLVLLTNWDVVWRVGSYGSCFLGVQEVSVA